MLAHKKGSPVSIDVAIKLWVLPMLCLYSSFLLIKAFHAVGYAETSNAKSLLVNMQ